MSENMRGAFLMMASMAAFTFNDAFIKTMAGDVPLFQVVFLRGIVTTIAMVIMAWYLGAIRLRCSRRDWGYIALRGVGEIGSAYFFITALFHMPLANVTVILQALPLTITLAAAIFLKEPVGWKRMAAILVGFVGVMIIIRPSGDDFSVYSLYALAAVACVTLRDLAARKISSAVPSMMVAVWASFGAMVFFGIGSLGVEWVAMDGQQISFVAGASVMIIGGYLFSVMVMRVGEISFIAPFRYTGLIWAVLLGWVIFGDWPSSMTLIGGAIVVSSGLFTLYRETRAKRRALKTGYAANSRRM